MRPVKDNDDKYFLQLINTKEQGFRDLSRMKLEHEMSNSIAVSLKEEKLPKTIRREWYWFCWSSRKLVLLEHLLIISMY